MSPIDDTEARKLIDAVFGERDQLAEHLERAQASATAFDAAADAFEHGNLNSASAAFDEHVNAATSQAQGAYDLCAAGALRIARLFTGIRECECGDPGCAGLDMEVRGAADLTHMAAESAVNAASAGNLDELGDVLAGIHRATGSLGLYALGTLLVSLRGEVRQRIEEHS